MHVHLCACVCLFERACVLICACAREREKGGGTAGFAMRWCSYGAAGTGKTSLVRAVCSESNVPSIVLNATEASEPHRLAAPPRRAAPSLPVVSAPHTCGDADRRACMRACVRISVCESMRLHTCMRVHVRCVKQIVSKVVGDSEKALSAIFRQGTPNGAYLR